MPLQIQISECEDIFIEVKMCLKIVVTVNLKVYYRFHQTIINSEELVSMFTGKTLLLKWIKFMILSLVCEMRLSSYIPPSKMNTVFVHLRKSYYKF